MNCYIFPLLFTTVIVPHSTYFSTNLFIYGDDHLVYAGACAAYDAEFCSRHVENSVCNKVKNECFCRKDFVAIRESGRVTCKTLLTDLKCRVDRDCVHVNRSSCHPGAGYCSCPGNTIYVPQLHACRNRLDYSRDVVCKACQQKRGICFLHEKYDQPEEDVSENTFTRSDVRIQMRATCAGGIVVTRSPRMSGVRSSNPGTAIGYALLMSSNKSETRVQYNQNRIGCVCPGSGQATRIKSDDWSSGICAGQLVDIGLQCDESVTFCRSRNAVCRRIRENTAHATSIHSTQLWQKPSDDTSERSSENNEVAVCQCKENTVPVYQTTLSYTECFPTLPFNASKCESCSRVNGECYDLNSDGIGDGCVCPPHLSTFRNRLDSNVEFCTQSHVATNCSDGFFSVCYAPHSGEPYEELTSNLLSGMAVVRLAPSTGGDNADVFGTSTDNTRSHISGFNPETVVSRGTAYRHFYTTAHVDSTKPQRHVASSLSHSCQLIEYRALQKTRTGLPYGRLRQSGGFGETSVDSDLFCVHLNVWQYQTQCGVRLYRLGRNVIQYEALLEILVNRSVRTPSQDLQIPIKCIAPEPKRSPDMNTKSSTGANEDFRATRTTAQITQSMTVELRLLSSANKEIDVTTEGTPIRLDILLVDNTGQYKFITVEQCYYSNRSILSGNKEQHILFIQNGYVQLSSYQYNPSL
ncbi:hypothetical protein T265_10545 [Opisthorchis viverrini]|uniref:ZP domain-containing protein n=1 Tax=Opisthorchis viverrini TaxID=6198 RepID=A0A074Z660_OPIVI|nr:hypothetical protein T265_10545 [Opisthorchis viverrini]KER21042.1 hypothetical protein T265_10545 [Opisthorchis viverrini]